MKPLVALALSLVLLSPVSGVAAPKGPQDPGTIGPYAIGHTSLLLVDFTRNADSTWHGRPIPVSVWYPIDLADVTSSTPEGVLAYDPLYNSWVPATRSSDWEHPCRNLPDPSLMPACERTAMPYPPSYEGVTPSQGGPFPVVLLSPGYNAYRVVAYGMFAMRLASHGFVVAAVQHFRERSVPVDPMDLYHVALLNRPRDLSFALDTLLSMNQDQSHLFYKSMVPGQVAVVGHATGGYTALAMAAGDDEVCVGTTYANPLPACAPDPAIRTLPDRRVKAVVTMDANNSVLHFSELARVSVPALTIGDSIETATASFFPPRQHAAISAHPNYRVDIRDTLVNSYYSGCTGVWVAYRYGFVSRATAASQADGPSCNTVVPQAEVVRLSAQYTVAFLKTHLVRETGYQHMLTPGWALTREPDVEFFVTEPMNARSLGEDPATYPYFLHQPGDMADEAEEDPASGPLVVFDAER